MTLGTHVHHPLAHWAHTRPHTVALASESQRLTFADLHARVQQRAAQLATAQAPATVLLPGTGTAGLLARDPFPERAGLGGRRGGGRQKGGGQGQDGHPAPADRKSVV